MNKKIPRFYDYDRIWELYRQGLTITEVSKRVQCCKSTASRVIKERIASEIEKSKAPA